MFAHYARMSTNGRVLDQLHASEDTDGEVIGIL